MIFCRRQKEIAVNFLAPAPEKVNQKSVFTVGMPGTVGALLFDVDYMVLDKLASGYGDIALAAIGDGMGVYAVLPPVILLISALLTAGYLLPVVVDAFFPGHDEEGHGEHTKKKAEEPASGSREPTPLMWVPMIVLCLTALLVGVFGTNLVTMII
jgi:NADH:ubiquinone oxidoreductase subunit 5 (subunit L)/multisubunit Na+/H+ antiporter MnhA subunit